MPFEHFVWRRAQELELELRRVAGDGVVQPHATKEPRITAAAADTPQRGPGKPERAEIAAEQDFIRGKERNASGSGPKVLPKSSAMCPSQRIAPDGSAWVRNGAGALNQDLPGFVVLPEVSYPQGGAANWGSGFLPAYFQGTPLRPKGAPILDLTPPAGITREHQRQNLDLIAELNAGHHAAHPQHAELAARTAAYELAFRMQMEVPGLLDLDGENEKLKASYGIGLEPTDAFGRKCLLARRLVEKGVRFVQLYAGTWDSHDYIERAHGNLVRRVDQPVAALLADLKQRGLIESTLVVWCGEFGRSPDNGVRGGTAYGRDHNPKAMTMWFAGGGVKAGHTIGATDEIGAEAVGCVHHVRDVHVTLLRLLGLDDNKLTYFHGGRFKQISQFGGAVIDELIG